MSFRMHDCNMSHQTQLLIPVTKEKEKEKEDKKSNVPEIIVPEKTEHEEKETVVMTIKKPKNNPVVNK